MTGSGRGTVKILVLVFILVLALAAGVFVFQTEAIRHTRDSAYAAASSSVADKTAAVAAALDGYFDALETFSRIIGDSGADLFSETVMRQLSAACSATTYSHMVLVDVDGRAVTESGAYYELSDHLFFQQSVLGARSVQVLMDDRAFGSGNLILSVPIVSGGKVTGVAAGVFSEENLRGLLNSEIFGPEAYTIVTTQYGRVVIGSENGAFNLDDDIFVAFSDCVFDKGFSAETIYADLQKNAEGYVSFMLDGEHWYAVYAPIGFNDWMIVSVIPGSAIDKSVDENLSVSMIVTFVVAGIAMALLLYSVAFDMKSARNIQKGKDDLTIAARRSGRYVFSYNIARDAVQRYFDSRDVFGVELDTEKYAGRGAYLDVLAPESRETYAAFFEQIRRGEPDGKADLLLRMANGSNVWFQADYALVCDRAGKPHHAVVTLHDDTEGRARELAYEKWRLQMKKMMSGVMAFVEVNLTQDKIEHAGGGHCVDDAKPGVLFGAFMQCALDQMVLPEDAAVFNEFFRRERLMALFYGGVASDALEFRARGDQDAAFYCRADVGMVRYPRLEEINLFVTFTNIDREKRERERLENLATRDSLTGLLNRSALKGRIAQLLADAKPDDTCAMLMIDLDNFKMINDTAGHQQGDRILRDVAQTVLAEFRDEDAVGRIGGDEFIAFICGKITRATAARKASALCRTMTFQFGNIRVSGTVGVAIGSCAQVDFEELYRISDAALYRTKRRKKGSFSVEVIGSGEGDAADEAQDAAQPDAPLERAQYAQLQTIVEHMQGGVIMLEVGADAIRSFYISPSFYRALCRGAQTGDALPDFMSFVHRDDAGRIESAIRRCAQGGGALDEIYRPPATCSEHGWRHIRATRIPYENAQAPVLLAVITDFTATHDIENALESDAEILRLAFGQTRMTLWEVDLASRLFTAPDAAGLDALDLPGDFFARALVHPDDRVRFVGFMDALLAGRAGDSATFIMRFSPDEAFRAMTLSYRTICGADGAPVRAVGVAGAAADIAS